MENFLQTLDLMDSWREEKQAVDCNFFHLWHILQVDIDFHMLSTSLHNVCNFKDWRLKEDKHQTREFKKNYEYKLHMIYTVELHPPITPSLK